VSNYRIISKGQGALHIDGHIQPKTQMVQWGNDSDEIERRAYVPYAPEKHCGGVTRIAHFCYTWKTFDTIEEAHAYLVAKQGNGYKVCKKCLAAAADAT